jgi:hypothetical protein
MEKGEKGTKRKLKQLGLQECLRRNEKMKEENEKKKRKQKEKAKFEKMKWLENHHRMEWTVTELQDSAKGRSKETEGSWRLQNLMEGTERGTGKRKRR